MDSFDRHFQRTQSTMLTFIVVWAFVVIALIGFGIWGFVEVIDILRHQFGG